MMGMLFVLLKNQNNRPRDTIIWYVHILDICIERENR